MESLTQCVRVVTGTMHPFLIFYVLIFYVCVQASLKFIPHSETLGELPNLGFYFILFGWNFLTDVFPLRTCVNPWEQGIRA